MKKLIISLCTLAALSNAVADDKPGMVIKTTTGENSVAIDNISSIRYGEGTMIVNLKSGGQETFRLPDVEKMTFTSLPTAIKRLTTELAGAQQFVVTDTAGKVVLRGTTDANGNVSEMPQMKGIYIITVAGKSNKVILR